MCAPVKRQVRHTRETTLLGASQRPRFGRHKTCTAAEWAGPCHVSTYTRACNQGRVHCALEQAQLLTAEGPWSAPSPARSGSGAQTPAPNTHLACPLPLLQATPATPPATYKVEVGDEGVLGARLEHLQYHLLVATAQHSGVHLARSHPQACQPPVGGRSAEWLAA